MGTDAPTKWTRLVPIFISYPIRLPPCYPSKDSGAEYNPWKQEYEAKLDEVETLNENLKQQTPNPKP